MLTGNRVFCNLEGGREPLSGSVTRGGGHCWEVWLGEGAIVGKCH